MDLFRFNDVNAWRNGETINGYESVSWVERYRDPGEFKISGRLSSGLREFLPLGTLISHVGTLEVMIVENHEVSEELDKDPELMITGRSFETFLENRIVGQNQDWVTPPDSLNDYIYSLLADNTWWQAVTMVNHHIASGVVLNSSDGLSFVEADTEIVGTGVVEARIIKRGSVHQRLQEILEIDDLGVKVIRSHKFDAPNPGPLTLLMIHNGEDKTNTVVFSSKTGDISGANYLWSIKKLKNAALVTGKFIETMVPGSATGYNKRTMFVDAQDIDGHLADIPTGPDLTAIRAAMDVRGRQALKAQKELVLSRSDISETQSYRYREDYTVGDIVGIEGSFGETLPMRVVEYAEIVDANGESGYPTLSLLEE